MDKVDEVRRLARQLCADVAARPKRERREPREEVYELGRALYEAATGSPPFEGTLPEGLRAPILRCLQRDPARRYATVAEVAGALGVADEAAQEPRRRGRSGVRRVFVVMLLLAIAAGGAALAWRRWGGGLPASEASAGEPVGAPRDAGAGGVAPAPRVVVAIAPFASTLDAAGGWLARAIPELLALSIAGSPEIAVRRDAVAARDPRRLGVAAVLSGSVEHTASGIVVDVKLLDVRTGALRFAERTVAAGDAELIPSLAAIAVKLRRAMDVAAIDPSRLELATSDLAALRAYIDGLAAEERGDAPAALASHREAVRRDPRFGAPAARLVLLGDDPRPADERRAALEALTRDSLEPAVFAALAAAYRAAGRPLDCRASGQRAIELGAPAALRRDLAWCALEAGDGADALALATEYAALDPGAGAVVLGDVHLMHGRFGEARQAYRRAAEAGAAMAEVRLALVDLHARGVCARRAVADAARKIVSPPRELEEAALAWASVARACGDGARQAEAQRWLLATLPTSNIVVDAPAPPPEQMLPIHRHPFLDAPPLLAAAIARAEAGDPEEATLACQEILAAAPTYAPAHYCLGRAAEAARDRSAAFRAYRELLDRWEGADEDNVMIRDARRRLSRVIRDTRAGAPSPP